MNKAVISRHARNDKTLFIMNTAKIFLALGSLNAMLAVMLGAYGAHGLKGRLAEVTLSMYQTGVQYHFYHSLGLILIGLVVLQKLDSAWIKCAGWLMLAGILMFSGSLYLISILHLHRLGEIAATGGMAFIFAWLSLFIGIIRARIH
jgi:uncharacterized membrane protein YgdD (TMEM256/DUF423 family)